MKHILFAISSLHGGGAERVVTVWASALAERGYRVSVLVYSRVDNEYPISDKVGVYPIAASEKECDDFTMLKRLIKIRAVIKSLKPNIIISFLPVVQVYVSLASTGLRIPRVETIRNNPWRVDLLKTKFAKLWLRCFRTCRALILQSEDQRAFFSEGVQKKAIVIPNPINSIYVENPKLEYNSSSHRIVAAGRLCEQKNYKMMIDSVKIVLDTYEDVSLHIYGAGKQEKMLRTYIEEQGLEGVVCLMGRSNELYRAYRDADLYLMSSDYEGMPNALAEAMAVGLPCISTDCKTGPRDLIDSGVNGHLVPCGDSKAFAEKIIRVFSMSDDEQRTMGCRARDKVISYCGDENSLRRLIDLIESL